MSELNSVNAPPPIGVLRRSEESFSARDYVETEGLTITDIDVIESLDRGSLEKFAYLLVDKAEDLSIAQARRLVSEYAPVPLIAILPNSSHELVERFTSAGFILAVNGAKLDGDLLLTLAISMGHVSEWLEEQHVARERAAVQRDRQRIARDLHDQVIQQLFSLGMDIERLVAPDPALRDHARSLADRLDAAIDALRVSVSTLKSGSSALVDKRLQRIADDASELSGRPVHYTLLGEVDQLDSETQSTLVAVMREAVANAVKHGCGPISVSLTVDDLLALEVRCASPESPNPSGPSSYGGYGLANLNNRAVARGGLSELLSLTDGTTLLRWSIPATPPSDSTVLREAS